jgi:hypothetical protein
MNGKVLFATIASLGMTSAYIEESYAACNATVNGRPMSLQECQTASQIYGSVSPGHYVVDDYGNWAKLGDPSARGNLYLDAQRPGAQRGRESILRRGGSNWAICDPLKPGCK